MYIDGDGDVHSLRDHVTVGNYSHTVTGPPWNSSHGALTLPNLLQIHCHFSSTDSYSLNFDFLCVSIEIKSGLSHICTLEFDNDANVHRRIDTQ